MIFKKTTQTLVSSLSPAFLSITMITLLNPLPLFSQEWVSAAHTTIPSLTVQGEASISKPANQLQMSIAVLTQGNTAQESIDKNKEAMNQVIESLKALKFSQEEFKTGYFSTQPIYSQRPHQASDSWQAKIIGYQSTNSLTLTTNRIEEAGKVIDTAISSGANRIDNLQFQLTDPSKFRDEAIAAATNQAQKNAEALSKASGVSLVRILSISLDNAQVRPVNSRQFLMAKSFGGESTPIEPDKVELQANVRLIYEIGQ